MDIFIKSFNRPYYLDRCIRSIYQHVSGDIRIKVLDDGTAPKYLQKIRALFPEVEIFTSPYYTEKVELLQAHIDRKKEYKSGAIPSRFWFEHIERASDIFLLMEDDIWFTASINSDDITAVMRSNDCVLLRLFWQGNKRFINGEKQNLSEAVERILPKIPWFNRALLFNRFKLTSILYRLGIIKEQIGFQLPFYSLYTVAGAFFTKEYWLYLWRGAAEKVYEPDQLKKADEWLRQNRGSYAKTRNEVVKTSYISSATGRLEGINFQMIDFNYTLNERWLSGELDVMQNFPNDFKQDYLKKFLVSDGGGSLSYEDWQKWIRKFKSNYESLGCVTE
jgi:glycosyltransferase involved in cell wall biosynthesis